MDYPKTMCEAEPGAPCRELTHGEMDQVGGGMKWERGTANSDVIDARGGQIDCGLFTLTLDINGRISGVQW